MAHYYDSHHLSHDHDHNYNRNLARRFSRDARHSTHPTQYIVNEGKMIVDERTLKHTNAIIYNAPGSTLRLSSPKPNPFAPAVHHHNSYLYPQASSSWSSTGLPIQTCRNCLQRREIYYKGYCHNCASLRLNATYQRIRDDRRVAFAPDRRMVAWR
ncbi:hypothetical protein F4820DRAFT_440596 [Hypoxylon rubiginosum]|uniref:Uncharacterized protein n=1 Tax=Hypoxylon rubiginosum TaxID=110542 RepID=A0ACB9YIH6_9PEZI|nr:hypothetical protein F4820DRAFT_440596 [Hypoxylon rubiginosum]